MWGPIHDIKPNGEPNGKITWMKPSCHITCPIDQLNFKNLKGDANKMIQPPKKRQTKKKKKPPKKRLQQSHQVTRHRLIAHTKRVKDRIGRNVGSPHSAPIHSKSQQYK